MFFLLYLPPPPPLLGLCHKHMSPLYERDPAPTSKAKAGNIPDGVASSTQGIRGFGASFNGASGAI